MNPTLVQLVYIHGFQGNDTTFQSFPTDLQRYLSSRIPTHLKIQSSIYPTYKSVKPISVATQNFLEWLTTQPPGPVILLGHSMGGLLAADAAIDSFNRTTRRIIGVLAFDTPYLGMHPHVVISGITSLFPKDDNGMGKGMTAREDETERDLNDESQVNVVDEGVTDDWDAFKKRLDASPCSRPSYGPCVASASPPSPGLSPMSAHFPSIPLFLNRTLSFISHHSNDPLAQWVRKHPDIRSTKRWAVEHFQFGICMFDPKGLKERYRQLVAWDGMWINYWTETVSRPRRKEDNGHQGHEMDREDGNAGEVVDNDVALLETVMVDMSVSSAANSVDFPTTSASDPLTLGACTKSEAKAVQKAEQRTTKAREKEADKAHTKVVKRLEKERKDAENSNANKMTYARHFVVLPTGLGRVLGGGEKWEKIPVAGVEDEVSAHTGLFIKCQNLHYEEFVGRIGKRLLVWCEAVK